MMMMMIIIKCCILSLSLCRIMLSYRALCLLPDGFFPAHSCDCRFV